MLCFGVSALFYFFFDAAQVAVKTEAAERVASGRQLEVISMSLADFNAGKTDDEVWIGGSLYDISSYSVSGNEVQVTVFHDKGEEVLVKSVVSAFDQNDQPGTTHQIGKRHAVTFNDGKILIRPFSLSFVPFQNSTPYTLFTEPGVNQLCPYVATPPPNAAFV
jgi:hypothetical protein